MNHKRRILLAIGAGCLWFASGYAAFMPSNHKTESVILAIGLAIVAIVTQVNAEIGGRDGR